MSLKDLQNFSYSFIQQPTFFSMYISCYFIISVILFVSNKFPKIYALQISRMKDSQGMCMLHYLISEFDHFRFMGECADCCSSIFEVKYLSVSIISSVHFLERRICIQHRLSCFYSVIFYQFTCNSDPFATFECTDFCFWICQQLFGYVFYFSGLYVQLSFI